MPKQIANNDPAQVALESARNSGDRIAAIVSAIALVFSAYSLWETSLKRADLRAYVPSVIHYSSPYQNTNFEVISIPVTLVNDGAQTATILSMELEVTDPRTNQIKRFYAADFGRWTMERTRSASYEQFAPLSLAGRTSRTEPVLFYTRGEQEKPEQLIREVGEYSFKLTLETAEIGGPAWLDALWPSTVPSVSFNRTLQYYDARAFNNGTLPMYAKDWQASASAQ